MSIASQESTLFDSTIRENIEYGDNSRKVTMEEVIVAAKMANMHTFVTSLSKVLKLTSHFFQKQLCCFYSHIRRNKYSHVTASSIPI